VKHFVVRTPDDRIHHARPDHGVRLSDGVTARPLCHSLRAKRLAEGAVALGWAQAQSQKFREAERRVRWLQEARISHRTMSGHRVKTLLNMLY
jgi:hypothetical protein